MEASVSTLQSIYIDELVPTKLGIIILWIILPAVFAPKLWLVLRHWKQRRDLNASIGLNSCSGLEEHKESHLPPEQSRRLTDIGIKSAFVLQQQCQNNPEDGSSCMKVHPIVGIYPEPPTISAAGSGIFIFWQLGALKILQSHYDLSQIDFRGSSAGGIAAVITCCGVDIDKAVATAYKICLDIKIYDRKLGLIGIWGHGLKRWMNEMLPDNAHNICSGRVKIVVTDVRRCATSTVDHFESKQDLINACLASSHIPFALDWNAVAMFRGRPYVDGSILDIVSGTLNHHLSSNDAFVLDFKQDPALKYATLDFMKMPDKSKIIDLMEYGKRYAETAITCGNLPSNFKGLRCSAETYKS
eukprot:jgi/Botrbrau1/22096/Bobra.0206s0022.1